MKQTNNIPTGYKLSQLGIIPQEWKVIKINDCCQFLSNNSLSRDKLNEKEGKLFNIHYGDVLIKYGSVLDVSITKLPYINDDVNFVPKHFALNGDIIIADTAEDETVGKSCEVIGISDEKIVSGLHTFWLRPKCNYFALKFLGYYVNSEVYHSQLYPLMQGIKVCSISKRAIENTFFLLPPLPEQKKIAEILGVWDIAIEKQTTLIGKLEIRKRSLMQQLLTCKGESHSPLKRLKGFSGKWGIVKAGTIFESISTKGVDNERLLSATQENGVIPRDMLDTRVTMPTSDTKSFKLVEIGDFVISLRSFQGGIEYSYYRGIVSPAYTVLKPKKAIDKEFYKQYFKSTNFIRHLSIAVIGIRDGKQISYEDFCLVKIPSPSIEEQTAIATILTTADHEITLAKQKLASLQQQKKGLMQVLLTGEKRVKI